MSSQGRHKTSQDHEHGTVGSYVVGFVLSIIFTLIPYCLVVNRTIAGTALLVTILGFAIIQMIIQITFFLHLGRGPKPRWNFFFFVSTVGIILIVVGGSIVIIHNLHYNMQPSAQVQKLINDEGIYQIDGRLTGACQGQYPNHEIIIEKGQVSPARVMAKRCDTLTFFSQNGVKHQITFGAYPAHQAYAGDNELVVQRYQNQTITLSQTGIYQFYDDLNSSVSGSFVVNQ